MTPALRNADQDLLRKLLLGQLPSSEVERLAAEYADDARIAELAESLAGKDDPLLDLLHNHKAAAIDAEGERLVARLLERLQVALPVGPCDETAVRNRSEISTEPGLPATAPEAPLPARLEYYRPIRVLGQGGMGTVYLAEDTRLGREVAVKTLRPELAAHPQAKERFLREARTAARLEHDHIVPIYYVGEADGTPFLAMPLLKGEPLDALIKRTAGPLPVALAVRLARETASGLAAAHERGLIHRDIKPGNIWLEAPGGRVKILDFGLAKAAGAGSEAEPDANLTASGAIIGTPAYMAPEQASGAVVDARADLFSLGCVLYEMLAGQRAFTGGNTISILSSLALHTPPAPHTLNPRCPAALSRLVMQLLAKDPTARPASAQAVIEALDELAAVGWDQRGFASAGPPAPTKALTPQTKVGGPALAKPRWSHPTGSPRRRRVALVAAVGLLLAGLGGVFFGGTIIRFVTNKGQIVIETDGANIEVAIKDGQGIVLDRETNREITFKPGEYNIEVTVKDAGGEQRFVTDHFTLTRGGKKTIDARWEVAKAKPATLPSDSADPDRRAAEWVLSIGGYINIQENGQDRRIEAVTELPHGLFKLTTVTLTFNKEVSDVGLAHFKDCKNITAVDLYLAQVSDAGLAHFKDCTKLGHLGLNNTKVTDAGLAHFGDRKDLWSLQVRGTQVSDAGLVHFEDCKKLTIINLDDTKVSNVSLERIAHFPKLVSVKARDTKVTEAGVKKLAAALPGCKIEWDGGVIEPMSPSAGSDRRAAEWVLSIGGTIKIKEIGQEREIKAAGDLPQGAFELAAVYLNDNPKVSDAGLAVFKDCTNLAVLNLYGTRQVSDAGLAHFKNCKNLTTLDLAYVPATDAGLAHFQDCKQLTGLNLGGTNVTDAGLAYFKNCKNLTTLGLYGTRVTDAGLAHFKDCKHLTGLVLYGAPVGDAGLAHFQDCMNLSHVELGQTNVSDAGISRFQKGKPFFLVKLNNTQVSDALLPDLAGKVGMHGLDLVDTRISLQGYEQLKAALVGVGISWSEGNRIVAESVLALGGTLDIGTPGKPKAIAVKAVADLPRDYFQVRRVSLAGVTKPLDKLPAQLSGLRFPNFDRLESLDLSGVSGFDYNYLIPIHGLRELSLANAGLNDASLAQLPKLPALERLVFDGNDIRSEGLAHLSGRPEWIDLSLGCPSVVDLFARNLAELKHVKRLSLAGSGLSDASIKHLKTLTNLETLDLRRTKVTAAGIAELQQALPKCRIESDEMREK